jgi:hypothetical protein
VTIDDLFGRIGDECPARDRRCRQCGTSWYRQIYKLQVWLSAFVFLASSQYHVHDLRISVANGGLDSGTSKK